jgi:hypothetical protein
MFKKKWLKITGNIINGSTLLLCGAYISDYETGFEAGILSFTSFIAGLITLAFAAFDIYDIIEYELGKDL